MGEGGGGSPPPPSSDSLALAPVCALASDKVSSLLREIEIHSQLQHPHTTRLHESLQSDEALFLIVDWAGDSVLSDLLLRRGRLRESQTASIVLQVCGGPLPPPERPSVGPGRRFAGRCLHRRGVGQGARRGDQCRRPPPLDLCAAGVVIVRRTRDGKGVSPNPDGGPPPPPPAPPIWTAVPLEHPLGRGKGTVIWTFLLPSLFYAGGLDLRNSCRGCDIDCPGM